MTYKTRAIAVFAKDRYSFAALAVERSSGGRGAPLLVDGGYLDVTSEGVTNCRSVSAVQRLAAWADRGDLRDGGAVATF